MPMEQIKHKYNVYLVGRGHGCYAAEVKRTFMGETWAVSEKKAASNVHYRIRQNGEKLPEDYSDSSGQGYVVWTLEAERA